jgi:hypothetical protein
LLSGVRQRDVMIAGGVYYVSTGALSFVSRRAFEAVTGPKLEWWLVQTVGALVTAVGAGCSRAPCTTGSLPSSR